MKILLIIDSLGSGGAQRQMVTLALLLKDQGFNVSFLLYADENFFKEEVENNKIPIHYIITKNYIQRIFKIRKFIRKSNYDGVISFMDVPNFLNNFAAIGGKKWKVITSERSSMEEYMLSKQGRIFAWFQRYSDTIVCNSYNSKGMWEKYYPQYKEKISVIYNPVKLPKITSEYIPKRNGKLNLIIAASYQYLKNPIGLIEALKLMSEENRKKIEINWYGRIEVTTGNTKAYDESVFKIKENNLENIFILNKQTKDIANKMYEADVVALFSELEGLPNAICEAMMIGKPIIMTKVSDFKFLLDDSNGFLCDWNRPATIKDALNNAINQKVDQLIDLGKQSKAKGEHLFSKEIIISQWIELLKN